MKSGIVGDFRSFFEMSITFVLHRCARADSVLRRWHHCTEPLSKTRKNPQNSSNTLDTYQEPRNSSESIRNPKNVHWRALSKFVYVFVSGLL